MTRRRRDLDRDQRTEDLAVGQFASEDVEQADARPCDERELDARARSLAARHPRDEDDGNERDDDPREDRRRGRAVADDSGDDRQDGGDEARDRSDDAHPADREPVVQPDDPDGDRDARRNRDRQGGWSRDRLPENGRKNHVQEDADDLDDEGDAQDRPALARPATTEVARAPGDGGAETEDDDGRARA